MKPKWLQRSLLQGPYITLCLTKDEVEAVFKHLKAPIADYPFKRDTGFCTTFENGNKMSALIYLDVYVGCSFSLIQELLVHEISHLVDDIFTFIGEKYPGTETRAYISQNLFGTFNDELRRRLVLDVDNVVEIKR